MKHFSRIILSIWIICGVTAGNAYSIVQYYGSKKTESFEKHFEKPNVSNLSWYSEHHDKQSDAILECENEIEDDNEKLFSETLSVYEKQYQAGFYLSPYTDTECEKRSNSLNILYCVFRIWFQFEAVFNLGLGLRVYSNFKLTNFKKCNNSIKTSTKMKFYII